MSRAEAAAGALEADLLAGLLEADVLGAASPMSAALADLLPEERALVERAVTRRQREFAQGRVLARQLLARLGAGSGPLLRDADRVPAWPRGVVGSISHTDGLCAVAVARQGAIWGVGLDVEGDEPLEAELEERVCTPTERRWLAREREARGLSKGIFSVKEAVFKGCFPHLRERWGFQDLEVELDPRRERFTAWPAASSRLAGRKLCGRVARRGRFWLAIVTLREGPGPG